MRLRQYTFEGTGPGPIAPDGCPVELYRQLPYAGDLADVETDLAACVSVLELGCGTGRLCRRLLELGLQVSGVDQSAAMLAAMPDAAERIHSRIEDLHLERTWGAVLLASQMINHPDAATRTAFVRAAGRHLGPRGMFVLKRHDPRWLGNVNDGDEFVLGQVRVAVQDVSRRGHVVAMALRYVSGANVWVHRFAAESLDTDQVERLLHQEGFCDIRWRGTARLWAVARRPQ